MLISPESMIKPWFAFWREDYYLYYRSRQSCLIYFLKNIGLIEVLYSHTYLKISLINFFKESGVHGASPCFCSHPDPLSPTTIITLASPGCSLILLPTSLTPCTSFSPHHFIFSHILLLMLTHCFRSAQKGATLSPPVGCSSLSETKGSQALP